MKIRPLAVIGSSSSEVFDYIFGDRPDYFPLWASGWSARGLRSEAHQHYLRTIMSPIPKGSNVILNFGCVDVNFNCRYMAAKKGIYDFKTVLSEAADGISTARHVLDSLGFRSIYAAFISPSIALPQTYWNKFGKGRQLPDRMLGRMYYDLYSRVEKSFPTIDVFKELTDAEQGSYLLKDEYMKVLPSHHPDYIKVQSVVWSKVKDIPSMLPVRSSLLSVEYPHKPASISELIKAGATRRRTCQ